jgi:hypothetical protein
LICGHDLAHTLGVLIEDVIEEALEVRRGLDVHARRMARMHVALAVIAAGEEAVQDVVLVRRHAETTRRHAHLLRQPASQHVAKIARWARRIPPWRGLLLAVSATAQM